MGPSKEGTRILHSGKPSTNMSKDMCPGNRPNFNTGNRLTPNGGGAGGVSPGSAPKGNAPRSPRASRPAIRGVFAPGTPASAAAAPGGSGGPPADVDELAATLGRPSRDAVVEVVEVAAATPAAGVETEALSRPGTAAPGPGVEPDAQPARRGPQARHAAGRHPGRHRPREPVQGYRPDSCRNTLQGGPAGRVVELDAEQPPEPAQARPPEGPWSRAPREPDVRRVPRPGL